MKLADLNWVRLTILALTFFIAMVLATVAQAAPKQMTAEQRLAADAATTAALAPTSCYWTKVWINVGGRWMAVNTKICP